MGYRSEICIGVFFKDKAQMDEILAVYAMQELVQKYGAIKWWEFGEYNGHPCMKFYEEHTKWYESFDEVKAVECIQTICKDFTDSERKFSFAYISTRIGEDENDIETICDSSDDLATLTYEAMEVERRLTINF
jgi:hypothetical protein